jgi:hypothetical protein
MSELVDAGSLSGAQGRDGGTRQGDRVRVGHRCGVVAPAGVFCVDIPPPLAGRWVAGWRCQRGGRGGYPLGFIRGVAAVRPVPRIHATRRCDAIVSAGRPGWTGGHRKRHVGQHLVDRPLAEVGGSELAQMPSVDELRAQPHHVLRRQLAGLRELVQPSKAGATGWAAGIGVGQEHDPGARRQPADAQRGPGQPDIHRPAPRSGDTPGGTWRAKNATATLITVLRCALPLGRLQASRVEMGARRRAGNSSAGNDL